MKIYYGVKKCYLLFIFIGLLCSLWGNAYAAKKIYLTIDDGSLGGGGSILSAINEEKVPVTLFLVGRHVEMTPERVALLVKVKENKYVTIANHSYTHAHSVSVPHGSKASKRYNKYYTQPLNVLLDMKKNQKALDLKDSSYSRLPARNIFRLDSVQRDSPWLSDQEKKKERINADLLYKNGFDVYGWDLEWKNTSYGRDVESVEKLIIDVKKIFMANEEVCKGHLILLMHDQMFKAKWGGEERLKSLIQALKQENYEIAPIEDYPNQEGECEL